MTEQAYLNTQAIQKENRSLRQKIILLEQQAQSDKQAKRDLMKSIKKHRKEMKFRSELYDKLLSLLDDLVEQAPNIMAMRMEEYNKENKLPDHVMNVARKTRYITPLTKPPKPIVATTAEDTVHFVNKLAEFSLSP